MLHIFLLKRHHIRNFVRLLNCIISNISILVFYLIILFLLPNCHSHLHSMLEPWHHLQCVRGKEFNVLKLSKTHSFLNCPSSGQNNIAFDMYISIAVNAARHTIWTQKNRQPWKPVNISNYLKSNFWKMQRFFFFLPQISS